MTRRAWFAVIALFALALILRLAWLTERPPHSDEGVNGWFTEGILEQGHYTYDPHNFHGPSYFYLLTASRAALGHGLWSLRLPAALLGAALCLTPLLLRRRIGVGGAVAAGVVLATSPTLVYYARYAIHETLLVGLGLVALGCVLRWSQHGRAGWLYGAAAAIAAMVATKETTILFLGVGGLWLAGESAFESLRVRRLTVLGRAVRPSPAMALHAAGALALMSAIHVTLFTGFFQTPGGIPRALARSFEAYFIWTDTGTGETRATGHEKPWCYYLHLGLRYELVLYVLAGLGLLARWRERWVRGPALLGLGLLVVYSAIPYKMPWLPMSWLAFLALPAGQGARRLATLLADEVWGRIGARTALVAAAIPALLITVRSSFVRPADKREQLAYVHTAADYGAWMGLIQQAGDRIGRSRLRVAVEHDALWPLPWSLKPYQRTTFAALGNEDVILVPISRAPALEARLTSPYFRRQFEYRHDAEPIFIYLRRARFVTWLGREGARFTVVGGAPAAVAAR